ncbi:MAG: hypothetical protein ACTSSG_08840 [Candidatus Heimdallarchaeaceae archaeon]
MKKRVFLKCFFISIVTTLLLSSIVKGEISPFVGVNAGDEFNFKIVSAHTLLEHNGTTYIESHMFDYEGKTVNIKVDAISEGKFPDYFLVIPINKTVINTTETINGDIHITYSVLDQWYETLTFLLPSFDYFVNSFDPLTYEFSPPESYKEEYKGLPVFASTNTSFYQQLVEEGIGGTTVSYNEEKANFTIVSNDLRFRDGTTNTTGYWNVTAEMGYYVQIDVNQGVLMEYSQLFAFKINIGMNNTKMLMKLKFENEASNTKTFSLNFEMVGPLIVGIGLLTLVAKRRRKRR